jgi:hypothetical protein
VRTDFLQTEINAGRYNPFGATVNSPAVIDAITTSLKREGESELTSFDAAVTGEVFDLPAGKVGIASGLEYRDESISDFPDEQFQQPDSHRGHRGGRIARHLPVVEAAIPLLETLEASAPARRLQRLATR